MCNNPVKISDVGFVACRECWQCRETKIDDWVGRNIAESKAATASHVVTLTYGHDRSTGETDHIRAAVLTYSDIQKYLKLLRANGFPVRYFVVGEYGSMKGRAHWHIILYWQGPVPDHVLRKNFMEKHWPHGWSYWDKATPEAVRYACKYILKDFDDDSVQGWGPMVSKKPPLGDAYFKTLALRYVDAGLSPQSLFYRFDDVRRQPRGLRSQTRKQFEEATKPVNYRMHGKTAENFLDYFIEAWRETHKTDPPNSEVVWSYMLAPSIKLAREADDLHWKMNRVKGVKPISPPAEEAKVYFSETANCYYADIRIAKLWFSTDKEGYAGWHVKIEPDRHDLHTTSQLIRRAGLTEIRHSLPPIIVETRQEAS